MLPFPLPTDTETEYPASLAYLPGRGQIEQDVKTGVTWFLDGSHTVDSIQGTAKWYRELVEQRCVQFSRLE